MRLAPSSWYIPRRQELTYGVRVANASTCASASTPPWRLIVFLPVVAGDFTQRVRITNVYPSGREAQQRLD